MVLIQNISFIAELENNKQTVTKRSRDPEMYLLLYNNNKPEIYLLLYNNNKPQIYLLLYNNNKPEIYLLYNNNKPVCLSCFLEWTMYCLRRSTESATI